MNDDFFRDDQPAVTDQDGPSLIVSESERYKDMFSRRVFAKSIRCRVTSASDELNTIRISPILRNTDKGDTDGNKGETDGDENATVADEEFTYAKQKDTQDKYRFNCEEIDFERSSYIYKEDLKDDMNSSKGDDAANTGNDDSPTEPSSPREPPNAANAYLRPSTRRYKLMDIVLDWEETEAAIARYCEEISGSDTSASTTSTEPPQPQQAAADSAITTTAEVSAHREINFSCDMPVQFVWHDHPEVCDAGGPALIKWLVERWSD
jgi:hypothetical protein